MNCKRIFLTSTSIILKVYISTSSFKKNMRFDIPFLSSTEGLNRIFNTSLCIIVFVPCT